MKKAVLVARDMGGCQGLQCLAEELIRRGWEVIKHLGCGKPIPATIEQIRADVAGSNIAVFGRSSSAELAKEELAASDEANSRNIPFGFYADSSVTYFPWTAPKLNLPNASFFFVITEALAQQVRHKYPRLQVVATGNPAWEQFCFPKLSRSDVREKLGLPEDGFVILSPGSKSAVLNTLLWGNIIEAAGRPTLADLSPRLRLVASLHPGDRNLPAVYDDLVKLSRLPVLLVTAQEMPTTDILPGCNLVVETCSTVGIAAAHQRIPIIDFLPEVALNRLEQMSGSRKWELCQQGAADCVYGSPDDLAESMRALSTTKGFATMRRMQEQFYPQPTQLGVSVKLMADKVEEVAL